MKINELIKISIIGLKENYSIADMNEVVRAIKKKVSEEVITKEVAFAMLEEISERSNPRVKMKHVLDAWEKAPRISGINVDDDRLNQIRELSKKGLKNQHIWKVQYEELSNIVRKLNIHARYNKLTDGDKERIIDKFIKNTKTLHLSEKDIQAIRGNKEGLEV